MLLVGDIGGTKTLLANILEPNEPNGPNYNRLENLKSYKSLDYKQFDSILVDYLDSIDNINSISSISLAVAGPVDNNKSKITNLDWEIDASKIIKNLNPRLKTGNIYIYNDLEAIAAACCQHKSNEANDLGIDIKLINNVDLAQDASNASKAIIAPGTGLGMAFSVYSHGRHLPMASQGGHISFAPNSKLQHDLLNYMLSKYDQVGLELICSGVGIPNILKFFIENKGLMLDTKVEHELKSSSDTVPVIINNALNKNCPVCVATVELFIEVLANAVQAMALAVYAKGGIYLAGGIALALSEYLQRPIFLQNFMKNSTMCEVLSKMPIYLCQNKNIALIGASKLLNINNKC